MRAMTMLGGMTMRTSLILKIPLFSFFFSLRNSKGIPLSQTPSSGIVEKYKGFLESYGAREVTDPLLQGVFA